MAGEWRAVLFDAGNTLIGVESSVGRIYASVAADYGVSVEPDVLERAFRAEWEARLASPDRRFPLQTSAEIEKAWWHDVVRTVFNHLGKLGEFRGRFDAYFARLHGLFSQPEVWRVFDDVPPALDALAAMDVRCAIVSNWDSRLPCLMDTLGLGPRFEFVLTSAEAGRSKPDPFIFQCALDRLRLRPDQAIYVGDSIEDDVRGAESAGLTPVLIDRTGRHPDYVYAVRGMGDVVRMVQSGRGSG